MKSKFNLKFDDSFNGHLFSTQGDTGREFEITIRDELDDIVNIQGYKLEFYVGNSDEVTKVEAEISENKFIVKPVNTQFKKAGLNKAQFVLYNPDGLKVGSQIFDLHVEESIENGATLGKNVLVDFETITKTMEMIKDYDKTFQKAEKVNQELAEHIDQAKSEKNNLDAGTSNAVKTLKSIEAKIKNANQLKENLDDTIQSAENIDGEIKGRIKTIDGWISNPEQFRGPRGPKGDRGPQGNVGPKGERGPQGNTGPEGKKGDEGPRGPQGLVGPTGPKGATGETGPRGPKGERGPQGPQGPMGKGLTILGKAESSSALPSTGTVGDGYFVGSSLYVWTGSRWDNMGDIKGPKGDKGEKGADGARGPQGAQGPAGADGKDGERGPQGPAGKDGERGPQGVPGKDGERGPQGAPGKDGEKGPKGDRGPQGPAGENATATNLATTSSDGLMSRFDKQKLNTGNSLVPDGGSLGQILKWISSGKAQWVDDEKMTFKIYRSARWNHFLIRINNVVIGLFNSELKLNQLPEDFKPTNPNKPALHLLERSVILVSIKKSIGPFGLIMYQID